MGIARPQHRTDQTSSLSVKDYQRVIHVLIVVCLKEGQLLLAVRRIVGRVNLQDNHGWRFSERAHILLLELAKIARSAWASTAFSNRESFGCEESPSAWGG